MENEPSVLLVVMSTIGFAAIVLGIGFLIVRTFLWKDDIESKMRIHSMRLDGQEGDYAKYMKLVDRITKLEDRIKVQADMTDRIFGHFRETDKVVQELKMHDSMIVPEITQIYKRIHDLVQMQDADRGYLGEQLNQLRKKVEAPLPTGGKPDPEHWVPIDGNEVPIP